jgi:hypothetical protein
VPFLPLSRADGVVANIPSPIRSCDRQQKLIAEAEKSEKAAAAALDTTS